MRERWRRPWTFLLLGGYAGVLCVLARVFYGSLVPQGDLRFSKSFLGLGAPLFWTFVAWQIAGWVPLGLLLAAPSLSAERERGALEEYVLAGLTGAQLVRAKWRSVQGLALVLVVAPLPIAAICFSLGGISPLEFISANALCVGVAMASCALGMSISAKHKTVSGAFTEALKSVGYLALLGCPLLFLTPRLPPALLLGLGALLLWVPYRLLSDVERDMIWLALRLEMDAPVLPDHPAPHTARSVAMEPGLLEFAAAEGFAGRPMLADELALYLNTAEVERERLDPPPSRLDLALQNWVSGNPLALREVTTQLRSWRRSLLLGEPPPLFTLRASVGTGATLSLVAAFFPPVGWLALSAFWIGGLAAIGQIALLSSIGFVRERRGGMIAQLHLCALSPLEIVGAKIVSPLVLTARFWGFFLLICALVSLSLAPFWMLENVLMVALLSVFASCVGTLCSLFFRHQATSASASVGTLLVALVVLPRVFGPMLFQAPPFLEVWWLAPLRSLRPFDVERPMFVLAPLFPSVPLGAAALFLWSLRRWRTARDESPRGR